MRFRTGLEKKRIIDEKHDFFLDGVFFVIYNVICIVLYLSKEELHSNDQPNDSPMVP